MSIAIVFPGQGSQTLGMLSEEAQHFPQVQETFNQASEILGYDLWQVTQADEQKLNLTEYTQPAILTASIALGRIYYEQGGASPDFVAGHSLGEYSALVASGALAFEDAVKLVATRGRLMQSAVPEGVGAMAAIIGLNAEQVAALCDSVRQEGEVLTPANFNSLVQTVVAGNHDAVMRLIEAAPEAGAKRAVKLPMSVPSHCDLLKPAADQFILDLQQVEVNAPQFPVIHNVDLAQHSEANAIREALAKQLYSPVRWVETIQWFKQAGVSQILEVGPGKILTGLNKRIVDDVECGVIDITVKVD